MSIILNKQLIHQEIWFLQWWLHLRSLDFRRKNCLFYCFDKMRKCTKCEKCYEKRKNKAGCGYYILSGENSAACLFTLPWCVDTYAVCQLSYLRWQNPINKMNLFRHKTMNYIVAKSKYQKYLFYFYPSWKFRSKVGLVIDKFYMHTYLQVTWSKLYTIS